MSIENTKKHQEHEGLLSPLIRDIRLGHVAREIRSGTTVLDLACGNGHLMNFLPNDCKYYGVDRLQPNDPGSFSDFLQVDLIHPRSASKILEWMPEPPDYITSVAFLEHISSPETFLKDYSILFGEIGILVGTTPHPRGRLLHDTLSKIGVCSRSGAEEHETFLDQKALQRVSEISGGNLKLHRPFLFGLNQLFAIEYSRGSDFN